MAVCSVGGVPGFTGRIGELAGLAWAGEVRVGEHRPCVRRASDALQPGTLNEMCVTRIGFARLHFEALLLVGKDAGYEAYRHRDDHSCSHVYPRHPGALRAARGIQR